MKVFFTTTPHFKVEHEKETKAIFDAIANAGHQHVNDYIVRVQVDDFYSVDKQNEPKYFDEIMVALHKADIVVFETSMPSMGVGLLLKEALSSGKGVIALHQKDRYPFFLGGFKDDRLLVEEYSLETLKAVVEESFAYLNDQMDTRFNFFISPKIGNYLDWVSKKKRLPRAVYLRKLIEEDMKKNKEYEE